MTFDDFSKSYPAAVAGLRGLTRNVSESGLLDEALIEIVKIRVSQINGCAFCLQFHLALARRHGVEACKLDLIPAWRDAGLFSAREQAALAWAERLARLADSPPGEEDHAHLAAHFTPDEITVLTIALATINAWNRIAVGLHFPPPSI